MHLYGAGSPSKPAAGEGVNEASYHRTPARSPKLIQSVSDQTEEKEGNIQHTKPHVKKAVVGRSVLQAAFPKGNTLRLF